VAPGPHPDGEHIASTLLRAGGDQEGIFKRPSPPSHAEDLYGVKGDNLSKIAANTYGAPNEWPKIYNANTAAIGSDPNLILPGQSLTIPP